MRFTIILLLITTSSASDYYNSDKYSGQNGAHTSLMKSVSDLLFSTSGSPKTSSPKQDIVRKENHSTERASSVEYANGIFIDGEVWSPPRNISGVSYTSFLEAEGEVISQNGLTAALLDSNDKKSSGGGDDGQLSHSSSGSEESFDTILNSPSLKDARKNSGSKESSEEKIIDCCCCPWLFCRIEE